MRMLESQKSQTAKILIRAAGRLFLADPKDICYATIEDGVITVVTSGHAGMEGQSNCRTLEELNDNLDPSLFWRAHRSFLVNIQRIREVVPWFKSSYQLRMDDKNRRKFPSAAHKPSVCASFLACNPPGLLFAANDCEYKPIRKYSCSSA